MKARNELDTVCAGKACEGGESFEGELLEGSCCAGVEPADSRAHRKKGKRGSPNTCDLIPEALWQKHCPQSTRWTHHSWQHPVISES